LLQTKLDHYVGWLDGYTSENTTLFRDRVC